MRFGRKKRKALLSHAKVIFLPLCLAGGGFHAGFVALVSSVLFPRLRPSFSAGVSTCFFGFGWLLFFFFFFLGGSLIAGRACARFSRAPREFSRGHSVEWQKTSCTIWSNFGTPRACRGLQVRWPQSARAWRDRAPFCEGNAFSLDSAAELLDLREKDRPHIPSESFRCNDKASMGVLVFFPASSFLGCRGAFSGNFLNGLNFSGAVAKLGKACCSTPDLSAG